MQRRTTIWIDDIDVCSSLYEHLHSIFLHGHAPAKHEIYRNDNTPSLCCLVQSTDTHFVHRIHICSIIQEPLIRHLDQDVS